MKSSAPAPQDHCRVGIGEVWQRRNGSTFTIEKVQRGFVRYYLSAGSRPQFREIAIDNPLKRYRRVA